jgi:hypothetical protein
LDIAPVLDGEANIGRVWAAQGTTIAARFRAQLAHWPAHASITLALGPDGAALASARMGSADIVECRGTVRQDGWQTFKLAATGLPADGGVPFELTVTYAATQELSPA